MNQRASILRRGTTLAAFLAVAGVSFEFGAVQNPAPVQPKTGLVEFITLFDLSPQGIAASAKLKVLGDGYQADMDRLKKEIEGTQARLSKFKAGTLDHAKLQIRIGGLEGTALRLKDALEQDMVTQKGQQWVQLYEIFEQAIEKVAKARGLDLVMRRSPAVAPDDGLFRRYQMLEGRKIWFSNPAMDITDAILDQLKVEAARTVGGGPGGAAKPDGK